MKLRYLPIILSLSGFLLVGLTSLATDVRADAKFYWPVDDNQVIEVGFLGYTDHRGIDIGVNTDATSKIFAAKAGEVVAIESGHDYGNYRVKSDGGGFGNNVTIASSDGYNIVYAHLGQVSVSVNQHVEVGTVLGYGSNSGATCGSEPVGEGNGCTIDGTYYSGAYSHLHFEVRDCNNNCVSINPAEMFFKDANGNYVLASSYSSTFADYEQVTDVYHTVTGTIPVAKHFQAARKSNGKIYVRNRTIPGTWGNWQMLNSGSARTNVALVSFQSKLHMFVAGNENGAVYHATSADGLTWTAWSTIGGSTDKDIDVQVFNNKLVLSVHGNNTKYYTKYFDGSNWSSYYESGSGNSNISSVISGGKLFQTVVGKDDMVYIRHTSDGATWSAWYGFESGAVKSDVNMIPFQDKLYLFARGKDGKLYMRTSPSTAPLSANVWWSWLDLSLDASGETAVTVANNKLYIAVRDINARLRLREFDGTNWQPWQDLGSTSEDIAITSTRNFVPLTGGDQLTITVFANSDRNTVYSKLLEGSWVVTTL